VSSVAVEGLGRTRGWLVTSQVSEVFQAKTFEEVGEETQPGIARRMWGSTFLVLVCGGRL